MSALCRMIIGAGAAVVMIVGLTSAALASPISYTDDFIGSGTLGGATFTNANVEFSVTTDTIDVLPATEDGVPLPLDLGIYGDTRGIFLISVAGIGTVHLQDPFVVAFTKISGFQGLAILGSNGLVLDEVGLANNPVLAAASLDTLTGALGPLSQSDFFDDSSNDIPTSGGVLNLTSASNVSFTAKPQGGSLSPIAGLSPGTAALILPSPTGASIVNGSLEPSGDELAAYYSFTWNSGYFSAEAYLGGTNDTGFVLQIDNAAGTELESTAFISTAGVAGLAPIDLPAGTYEIGITGPVDPSFQIFFGNPVSVAAPEPASLALFGTAFLGLVALRRRKPKAG